jgi:hypothetical protein
MLLRIITVVETRFYIANPKPGDVYYVHDEKDALSAYRFMRVAKVKGDSVVAYQNNIRYLGQPDKFDEEDYFVEDHQLNFTKAELKQMFEKDEITEARRNYGNEEGVNRVHNYYINIKE